MRIIGGRHHRRIIHPPSGLPVRPTTDKAKEALFNVLNHHIDFEAVRVLDLFAGTGNISFEFASRDASEVMAVDNNARCIRFIRQVKETLQMDNITCIRADVLRFLPNTPGTFDVVFADPPYNMKGISELPDKVLSNRVLKEEGIMIIEHPADISFESHPSFQQQRNYSKVHFSFFELTGMK